MVLDQRKFDLPEETSGSVRRPFWLPRLGGTPGPEWVEARNAPKCPQGTGQAPEQRIIWPKVSAVPKLRNPALSIASVSCWTTS